MNKELLKMLESTLNESKRFLEMKGNNLYEDILIQASLKQLLIQYNHLTKKIIEEERKNDNKNNIK